MRSACHRPAGNDMMDVQVALEIDAFVAQQATERKQVFTAPPSKDDMMKLALDELCATHPIRTIVDPSERWQIRECGEAGRAGTSGSVICVACRAGETACDSHIVKRMPNSMVSYREWILSALAGELGIGPRVVDAWVTTSESKESTTSIVMDKVQGVTLAAWFDEHAKSIAVSKQQEVWDRVGAAVRRMHDSGIVHRDLHLGNIMVSPTNGQTVWIIDFGEAEFLGHKRAVSSTARHEEIGSLQAFAETRHLSMQSWLPTFSKLEQHADAGTRVTASSSSSEDALDTIDWDRGQLTVTMRQRTPSFVAWLRALASTLGSSLSIR